jgi:DNA-directed RNA polymerase subunit K/omega
LITQHELLDTAIQKVGNRYVATMLVAKRIRQLHHGAPSRVRRVESESDFSVTVREIAEGFLVLEESAPDTPEAGSNGAAHDTPAPAEEATQEQ